MRDRLNIAITTCTAYAYVVYYAPTYVAIYTRKHEFVENMSLSHILQQHREAIEGGQKENILETLEELVRAITLTYTSQYPLVCNPFVVSPDKTQNTDDALR